MAKHTPMRAAKRIEIERSYETTEEDIAQIIDRETGVGELLEALEGLLLGHPQARYFAEEKAHAAIAKARGEES